jgi:hypothetical protein
MQRGRGHSEDFIEEDPVSAASSHGMADAALARSDKLRGPKALMQRFAPYKYAAIGLISCSMLMHEILLTRICGLRLYFHFAFLVISNCLLGLGASGTVLTLYQDQWKGEERRQLGRFGVAYLVTLVASYVFLLEYPVPAELDLGTLPHLLTFTAYNLGGAVPFFFGGLVVGMLLTFNPVEVDRLYAVDLVGAGIGCATCPLLLPLVGAGGVFVVSALLGLVAIVVVLAERHGRRALLIGGLLAAAGLSVLPILDQEYPVPSKGYIDFIRAIEAAKGKTDPYSVWTANSRIDLLTPPDTSRSATFGRGTNEKGLPPHPEFRGIAQDASAGTVLVNFSDHPESLALLGRTTYSAAFRLKERPQVFIIGLGGGNDAWAAKVNGASHVKAVELNWPIVEIHREVMHEFSRVLVDDPSVEIVVGEGRSELMRDDRKYDVIQMSGVDTWTALASGAYVLAENYLYTREAIALMYDHLAVDGILQITRFAETMEALRLTSNIHAALESKGVRRLAPSIMAVAAPDKVLAVLVKKGVFSEAEERSFVDWTKLAGLDVWFSPRSKGHPHLTTFILSNDKARLIRDFPRDISPTTDDQPYFFSFTRWDQVFESKDLATELPSVSQGNPFFILTQLLVSGLLSVGLIFLPLARRTTIPKKGAYGFLGYFASLGLGFIFIEIAAMQKLTLFLGQPVYSITVTLFCLLVFTGLGSLFFARRIPVDGSRVWLIPGAVVASVALFVLVTPWMVKELIGLSLFARVCVVALLLAPIGLSLGVPFAFGIRAVSRTNPELLPWAWAINGCFSVCGSILTVVISMNFGFQVVLWTACAVYALGFAALAATRRGTAMPALAAQRAE